MDGWTFLTNHAHVYLCLAADPEIRLRDVADKVGITERAAQRIVADLETEGYVESERVGRRNHYVVHSDVPLRHPLEKHSAVGTLLQLLEPPAHPPANQRGRRHPGPASRGHVTRDPGAVSARSRR